MDSSIVFINMRTDSIHCHPPFSLVFVKYRYFVWFSALLLMIILVNFARYGESVSANVGKKEKIVKTLNQDRLEYFLAKFRTLGKRILSKRY